jgi:hypothetical protein
MSADAIDIHATPAPGADSASLAPIAGGKPKSALIAFAEKGIALRSMEDAFIFAKAVIDSGLAPKSFTTPQAVLVVIQFGAEVGLPPMAALQNIALINGRPAIWGDAVPGVCNSTGLVEAYKDEQVGADDSYGYRVTIMRKGRADPIVRTFTVAMAKKAGLWGKSGPWQQYPERMLLMRARTFAFRDAFPDALRGLPTAEEMRDHPPGPEKNVTRSLDELDGKTEPAAA